VRRRPLRARPRDASRIAVDFTDATVIDKALPVSGEPVTNVLRPRERPRPRRASPGPPPNPGKARRVDAEKTMGVRCNPAALSRAFSQGRPGTGSSIVFAIGSCRWVRQGTEGRRCFAGESSAASPLGKGFNSLESHCPNNHVPGSYALASCQMTRRRSYGLTTPSS